jgi:Uma2 family endonuclease
MATAYADAYPSFSDPEPRMFTAADLAAMPDELPSGPVNFELENGRFVLMSPTGWRHGNWQSRIAAALMVQGEQRGHGKVGTESGVVLRTNPDRVVGPDVLFVATRAMPVQESPEGFLLTIPNLVVEVRSKNDTTAYLNRKISDYQAAGVEVVWVVDPETTSVTEYQRQLPPKKYGRGDTLCCEGIIPGFQLSLDALFAS